MIAGLVELEDGHPFVLGVAIPLTSAVVTAPPDVPLTAVVTVNGLLQVGVPTTPAAAVQEDWISHSTFPVVAAE
jgi:hypothetical protein